MTDALDGGYDAERLRELHADWGCIEAIKVPATRDRRRALFAFTHVPALLSALEAKDAEIARLRDGKAMLAQHANAVAKAKDAALERAEAVMAEAQYALDHGQMYEIRGLVSKALTALRARSR